MISGVGKKNQCVCCGRWQQDERCVCSCSLVRCWCKFLLQELWSQMNMLRCCAAIKTQRKNAALCACLLQRGCLHVIIEADLSTGLNGKCVLLIWYVIYLKWKSVLIISICYLYKCIFILLSKNIYSFMFLNLHYAWVCNYCVGLQHGEDSSSLINNPCSLTLNYCVNMFAGGKLFLHR